MTKKLNSFESLGNINFKNLRKDISPKSSSIIKPDTQKKNQNLEAHFSNKGRAGKVVTIIKGFDGDPQSIKKFAKSIKTHTGSGGTVKNKEIIIQGNFRDKIIIFIESLGYKVKRVGG